MNDGGSALSAGNTTGRVIAIGDVHGMAGALAALLAAIAPVPADTIVMLGDLCDHGPDSRGVLNQVIRLRACCRVKVIRGNHEDMLLAAPQGKSDLAYWLKFGGRETLQSYGVSVDFDMRKIPWEHLQLIRESCAFFETDHFFFTHGYYDPDGPLAGQNWDRLRWCAVPAEPRPHVSGKVAVVGHTEQVTGRILDLGFLKCIDTFCRGGQWLTALDAGNGEIWQANEAGMLRRG